MTEFDQYSNNYDFIFKRNIGYFAKDIDYFAKYIHLEEDFQCI